MHSRFCYAKTLESYNYDYSSDHAIWAISLVHYWCTHAFQVANCNGFYFNASPLGLKPDGALYLSMILYDLCTETYVNNNAFYLPPARCRYPNFILSFLPHVCCSA